MLLGVRLLSIDLGQFARRAQWLQFQCVPAIRGAAIAVPRQRSPFEPTPVLFTQDPCPKTMAPGAGADLSACLRRRGVAHNPEIQH